MAASKASVGPADPGASSKTMKLENTEKRDSLIEIEKRYQKQWKDSKVFEADAPLQDLAPQESVEQLRQRHPKAFMNFAFPYMNGSLHVGHSFTISKTEFFAGFSRMQGKRTLFPLGYHCTGMPIKACADKLIDEVKKFGKNFEGHSDEEAGAAATAPAPTQSTTKEDVTKFSAKKGKASAKTVKAKYQFQIMLSQGLPREEIHKFADPDHWLQYFPPICQQDLSNFGARIDWRRQFVTTDANPYFDSFVRWQMTRLHELNKIQFGARYTIYSPKDGQPCMDHDRSEGEAVLPQEYTALKLKVKEWSPKAAAHIESLVPKTASVYFVPATLRPETMYGQTCCFVGPDIVYGVFKVSEHEYFVFTKRAAWNLAFQGFFFDQEKFPRNAQELNPVVELPGSAFIGTLVDAPLSVHSSGVRILPMETVLATKGTGVVTCVPSDSPDDYATVRELAKKAEYYHIQKEWAELEVVPIIETPSYGNLTAKHLVEKMKINSPKDTKLLAEAKDLAYKEGFYKGKMLIGKYKGEPVEEAKPQVREILVQDGLAFPYAEPAGRVVSRSADECVVAHLGQWFLNYGDQDAEWKDSVSSHVRTQMSLYAQETLHAFEGVLEWLNRWACARTYGLGSRLPWDPKFLVESLSDSTIYMAYYTIAHYLHSDLFGTKPGIFNIKPEQMTDEVWDWLLSRTEWSDGLDKRCGIPQKELEQMHREFEYWYPVDVRVSGKDLIPNHLTFFIYIHNALFPKRLWPRGVRANGHLLLNGEKMSKSTGNFMTLSEAVGKFGADATRVALADAGDGVEDANFDESVANSSILRLFTLKEWCEEIVKDNSLRTGAVDGFFDKLFENELNGLVREAYAQYKVTNYKLALKAALYDFTSARDFYREATAAAGIGMHKDLVTRYIELQALLLAPIAPHWCDYIWQEVVHKSPTIQRTAWPTAPEPSPSLTAARDYVRATASAITSAEAAQLKRKDKGKAIAYDPKQPKRLTVFAATAFPAWQDKYVDLVRQDLEAAKLGGSGNDKELAGKVAKLAGKGPETKKAMPFVQGMRRRLQQGEAPAAVLQRELGFDEIAVLREMVRGLRKTTGCAAVEVVRVDEGGKGGRVVAVADNKDAGAGTGASAGDGERRDELPGAAEGAVPGVPTFNFTNLSPSS